MWLVSHVLRPKNGGFFRVDSAEIHLVYILVNKVKVNWPRYWVSRMFDIKKCNKGTSFCYNSTVAKILNYFKIGIPNLSYKSPGPSQEFSLITLTNMNYF